MRYINTVLFFAVIFCYAFLTIVHIVSWQGLSEASIYVSKPNSFHMYLSIVLFVLLALFFLGNFFSLKKYPAEVWILFAYMVYNVICTCISTFGFGSIKYTGTGVIYSNIPILFFFAFYFCARQSFINKFLLENYILLLFIINGLLGVSSYFMWAAYSDEYVLMQFYQIFLVLPWLLVYNVKIFRVVLILTMGLFVAYAAKRGAFICYVGGIIIYFFIKNVFIENKYRALHIFGLPVVLIFIFSMLFYFFDFSYVLDRIDTIESDAGSGRLYIWQFLIREYFSSDILSQILGHGGYYASKEVLLVSALAYGAHNDFLAALYDYGLVGFLMLLSLFALSSMRFLQMLKSKYEYTPAFAVWLFCFFVLANISALFSSGIESLSFFSFWGYFLGSFLKDMDDPHFSDNRLKQ